MHTTPTVAGRADSRGSAYSNVDFSAPKIECLNFVFPHYIYIPELPGVRTCHQACFACANFGYCK